MIWYMATSVDDSDGECYSGRRAVEVESATILGNPHKRKVNDNLRTGWLHNTVCVHNVD